MSDKIDGQEPTQNDRALCQKWFARFIGKIKVQLHECCIKKKNEKSTDCAENKMAAATCAIAVLAGVSLLVSILQFFILRGQLTEAKVDFAFIHRPHFRVRFAQIKKRGALFLIRGIASLEQSRFSTMGRVKLIFWTAISKYIGAKMDCR